MRHRAMLSGSVCLLLVVGIAGPAGASAPRIGTDATFVNDAAHLGADPYVLHDKRSGQYYAYSTEGADPGHHFAIYRSPDLATWQRLPGGALSANDPRQWGNDWFWAPEVYHNAKTGKYFLFYSARMNENVARHFRYPDFEEASKVGVAVADSPAGPFRNIANRPIDYYPYDPNYHDVNLIMDEEQKKPPETLAEGRKAPLGTYIPFIDPNVYFDNGKVYLYFSRNAYRNWVWDSDLGRYIEESNIYAVRLTADWWHDPRGRTMPRIAPSYRDVNDDGRNPGPPRKDGFTPILNYGSDKQDWENAHVSDYEKTGGEKKNRRWAEGSSILRSSYVAGGKRRTIYYLTYSANNYENEFYGMGYATASSPLGPWRKSKRNPILTQNAQKGIYSTGHGSIIGSPDDAELYYVHHARPSTDTPRSLYTHRLRLAPGGRDRPATMDVVESTSDQPLPSGLAPLSVHPERRVVSAVDGAAEVRVTVRGRSGAAFPLSNQANRVRAKLTPPGAGMVTVAGHTARVTGLRGPAALTLTYQRATASGAYTDVHNTAAGRAVPVATNVVLTPR